MTPRLIELALRLIHTEGRAPVPMDLHVVTASEIEDLCVELGVPEREAADGC